MSSAAGTPSDPSPGRWSRLLQQSTDPLYLLNSHRRLLYANPAWEKLAGVALADVRGRACRHSKATSADAHSAILHLMAPTHEAVAGRPSRVRRRGEAVGAAWVDIQFFPWMHDGQTSAILGRIAVAIPAPAGKHAPLPEKVVQLRERTAARYRLEHWESDVALVQQTVAQARLASRTDVPVLIHGPPGSGKQWLARTIHRLGPRREEFVAALDARIVPPSLLAERLLGPHARANLGAVVLRNPSRLPVEIQSRLVELLDDGEFRPRLFVCAAEDELNSLTPIFLARVGTLTIATPPLKARRGDWPRLVAEALERIAVSLGKSHLTLAPDADQVLRLNDWPGNFTELEESLRSAARRATGERIELGDLPFALRTEPPPAEPKLPLDELLEKTERNLIQLALAHAGGNKSKAAGLLGVWRARLLRRMEQLGIADAEPKSDPESGGPADA